MTSSLEFNCLPALVLVSRAGILEASSFGKV